MRSEFLTIITLFALVVIACAGLSTGLISVESIPNWLMALMTLGLVNFAYHTIKEGKRNRRKDTIERQLEELYSPLYETLRRAGYESDDLRRAIHDQVENRAMDYVLEEKDLDKILGIIERFGHYLGSEEQARFSKALRQFRFLGVLPYETTALGRSIEPKIRIFTASTADIEPHFKKIMERRKELIAELDELTKKV